MAAVSNLAAEKYRVVLAQVPFVDVVTTMLDASIPLTTNEYDEYAFMLDQLGVSSGVQAAGPRPP